MNSWLPRTWGWGWRHCGGNREWLVTDTEKAMAPYSSTLAWKIPRTEEPGGLQSMGSRRVGHDWATSLSFFTFMYWRRKWRLTPVFLPGESQGRGSLVGCRLWGRIESGTTKVTAAAANRHGVSLWEKFLNIYSFLFILLDEYATFYLFFSWWTFGCFPLFMANAALDAQVSVWIRGFIISLGVCTSFFWFKQI